MDTTRTQTDPGPSPGTGRCALCGARTAAAEREDRQSLRALGLRQDDVLLHLGSGEGEFACRAARLCRRVYAVDDSASRLARGEERADRERLHNVVFRRSDPARYAHTGEAATAATVSAAPAGAAERAALVETLVRALAPGSRVLLAEGTDGNGALAAALSRTSLRTLAPRRSVRHPAVATVGSGVFAACTDEREP